MRVPTGILSNATVVSRKGISRDIALRTHATTNRVLNKDEGLKQMITTNKKSLYKRPAPSQKIARLKNAPTKYWAIWRIKRRQSKTNLLKSSEMGGIFHTPEPDGLGEGFTL